MNLSFSKEGRFKQMEDISAAKYNLIIGGLTLYGLVMNLVLCMCAGEFVAGINPAALLIGYFVCCIVGSIMSGLSHNPIVSFIGYNLVAVPIGAILSLCLPAYDSGLIMSAIGATAVVTLAMILLSVSFPSFFDRLGGVLFASLLIACITELIFGLFGMGGDIFNWIFVVIFSLYIGYDWNKAQKYPKTLDNAVDCALDLYLDIINLFLRLLSILSKAKD
jgi:FtsH-binding integral membrane protein